MELIKLQGEFCITPSIDICWVLYNHKNVYDIKIAWLKWMITTTNIKKALKNHGY